MKFMANNFAHQTFPITFFEVKKIARHFYYCEIGNCLFFYFEFFNLKLIKKTLQQAKVEIDKRRPTQATFITWWRISSCVIDVPLLSCWLVYVVLHRKRETRTAHTNTEFSLIVAFFFSNVSLCYFRYWKMLPTWPMTGRTWLHGSVLDSLWSLPFYSRVPPSAFAVNAKRRKQLTCST